MSNQRQTLAQGSFGFRAKLEAVLPDEFQRPQHSDRVFFKPQAGVADSPHDTVVNVIESGFGVVNQLM